MPETLVLHATAVAFQSNAVLIRGPSGSGKSALALELMAYGATLVADDQTRLAAQDGAVMASCPSSIDGRIEARFMGILRAEPAGPSRVVLIVDLGQTETERLPPARQENICGVSLPLLHKIESGYFPAAILQYLRAGLDREGKDLVG